MLKRICTLAMMVVLFAACSIFSPYGKKVTINNSLEIYIKGDSTTETDARKLGDYLTKTWKDITNKKSFQLIKENGGYTVKMVVDTEKLKADSTLDISFMALRMLIADEVFKGSKVKLVLTDNKFKDVKTFDDTPAAETPTTAAGDSSGIKK
jgi:hypothetical protein